MELHHEAVRDVILLSDVEDELDEADLVESDNRNGCKNEVSRKSACFPAWCNITAEPVLILYIMSYGIRGPQLQLLIYEKICRAKYNETVCQNLGDGTFDIEEDVVQSIAARWSFYFTMFFEVPAIFFTFYYGSIGDSISRRLSMLIPLLGEFINVTNMLIHAIFIETHVAWLIIGCLGNGFTGGWLTAEMAAHSFVSEASTEKARTSRISIMEGWNAAGLAITFILGGIIYDHTNYYVVFSLSLAILLLSIIYLGVFVREPDKSSGKDTQISPLAAYALLKATFSVVTRKRPNRGRIRLNVLLIAIYLSMISHFALPTLQFLYVKRRPLSWGQTEFGLFQSAGRVIHAVVQIFAVPLMVTYCHVTDTALLFVGIISGAVSELFFSFCTKTWMVFMVPILGMMASVRFIALRSLVSKIVHKQELGRVFSLVGALQSLTGMTGTAIYNNIYPHTLTFWPGLCFAVGSSVAIIPLFLTGWVHKQMGSHHYKELDTSDPEHKHEGDMPMTQIAANKEDDSDSPGENQMEERGEQHTEKDEVKEEVEEQEEDVDEDEDEEDLKLLKKE